MLPSNIQSLVPELGRPLHWTQVMYSHENYMTGYCILSVSVIKYYKSNKCHAIFVQLGNIKTVTSRAM